MDGSFVNFRIPLAEVREVTRLFSSRAGPPSAEIKTSKIKACLKLVNYNEL